MSGDLKTRFSALPRAATRDNFTLVTGSMRDYDALAPHHYRADRPATVTRVLALRRRWPSVIERWQGQRDVWRSVAVLVESVPTLHSHMRDVAMRGRYGAWPAGPRAALLKRELRCLSRVIVHPQWRGLGLAVWLVRHALATAATPLTEAHAAMGRVHPFFERAGMRAYPRPPRPDDARLLSALRSVGFDQHDLALIDARDVASTGNGGSPERDGSGLRQQIEALPAHQRAWLYHELTRWHRQLFRSASRHDGEGRDPLRAAQTRLLLEPVYYLHDNRAVQTSAANVAED